ncbi:MAG: retroviral-like aspartic protease family protein [Erythrobacter sp.]
MTLYNLPALACAIITISAASAASTAQAAHEPPGAHGVAASPAPLQAIAPLLTDPLTDLLMLEEQRDRRLTMPVMIDGKGPFRFMVDTGSQATAVAREINAFLMLPPAGRANLLGMASVRPVDLVAIERLDIGKHLIENLAAPILERGNIGADGIIGLDSLQDFRVVLDFREPSIALQDMRTTRNTSDGFEIIVRAKQQGGQLLITNAMVEGIRTTVIIDTGAQASLANLVLREKLRRKREAEVVTTDVNGVDLLGHMAVVRSLKIDALTLSNVPLAFADSPVFAALGLADTPVLALGMQHLRLFDRVGIDFSNNRILFDLPRDVSAALREAQRNPYRL